MGGDQGFCGNHGNASDIYNNILLSEMHTLLVITVSLLIMNHLQLSKRNLFLVCLTGLITSHSYSSMRHPVAENLGGKGFAV